MEDIIQMSSKELNRSEVINLVNAGRISQLEAARILSISDRQMRRLMAKYKQNGATGLISRKRGMVSNHQLPAHVKELALELIKKNYHDFGPTLAREKLIENHEVKISYSSIRDLMIANDLWTSKRKKHVVIHQLRKRRSQEGELVQMDGSPHDWFEGRGPRCTLIHCVDDATGKILTAKFVPSESVWSYFFLMESYFQKHGKPKAFYVDKHSVFRVNAEGALTGKGVTQFGRAMKDLGINLIFANSPQAKGRIERSNKTLQDRLVKELRLQGISTPEEANTFLPIFLEDLNRRFAVVPQNPCNAHTRLTQEYNLDVILSIQTNRILSKNLTFQYNNTIYQIQTDRSSYTLRRASVTIIEKSDGSIGVFYKNKPLVFSIDLEQEKQGAIADAKTLDEIIAKVNAEKPKEKYIPSKNHPWKRSFRKPLMRCA
jgi:hypothetical protein